MNIEPARPFCFLMKGDSTTYEVDLGEIRKEKKNGNQTWIWSGL